MQAYKTVLIFPIDDSVEFLRPIVDFLLKTFENIIQFEPAYGKYLEIDDEIQLVIFIGHGTSSVLCGNLLQDGEKYKFLDIINASVLFADLSIMLLSCRSIDFIKNVRHNVALKSFLGFGDMPTDWNHIAYLRDLDSEYLKGFEEEHLEYYKNILVKAFINGLTLYSINYNFRAMYLGMQQVINAAMSEVIIDMHWDKSIKNYLVDLLLELKTDMKYL
ncbi:hypothetical protein [Mucilaginibacter gilvus]|uniref:CHAT domain-containing protein n=1 Tax=Mucilaginibacter gilvus TaxID=2305909 RepID=A0A3S3V7X0_9SPHI|nr:hypothetical protein [Mucilaginibacter gilvus]RWY47477.1 hypothetical protein EPL05_21780 [Mucilaginibacter gilvus]